MEIGYTYGYNEFAYERMRRYSNLLVALKLDCNVLIHQNIDFKRFCHWLNYHINHILLIMSIALKVDSATWLWLLKSFKWKRSWSTLIKLQVFLRTIKSYNFRFYYIYTWLSFDVWNEPLATTQIKKFHNLNAFFTAENWRMKNLVKTWSTLNADHHLSYIMPKIFFSISKYLPRRYHAHEFSFYCIIVNAQIFLPR